MTGNGSSYHVDMSGFAKASLKQRHLEAAKKGEGKRFVAAVGKIVDRLRHDPTDFGEPLYHLQALKLQVRQAVVDHLVVEYGVHAHKPLVIIRSFKVLPA